MSILQWLLSGITVLSLWAAVKKLAFLLWNKYPAVQQLKKDQNKCAQLESEHVRYLALIKAMIAEFKANCIATIETRLDATQIEVVRGSDRELIRKKLIIDISQSINNDLHRLGNTTYDETIKHYREIMKIEQEYQEET